MTVNEKLQKVINTLLLTDKFVHYFLFKVNMRANNNCETARIGIDKISNKIVLEYNEQFFSSLSKEEITFVLTHEIYHLVLRHIFKPIPRKDEIELFNIAADLAVNTLIRENSYMVCPTDEKGRKLGVYPENFGFPEGLSIEKYIVLLRNKRNVVKIGSIGLDEHTLWKEDSIIEEAVISIIEAATKRDFWGSVSMSLKEQIESYLKSKVNWVKKLRIFCQGLLKGSTYRFTTKKINRRYGFLYPGKDKEYTDKLLVAVDTSASIEQQDLSQFLAEINKISESFPVDVCTFDVKITEGPMPWKKKNNFVFKGRGGTSYKDVMNLVEKNKIKNLIILTDGMADKVEKPSCLKYCLWAITNKAYNPPVNWGERIYLDGKD